MLLHQTTCTQPPFDLSHSSLLVVATACAVQHGMALARLVICIVCVWVLIVSTALMLTCHERKYELGMERA
jgi:hypothetical protein